MPWTAKDALMGLALVVVGSVLTIALVVWFHRGRAPEASTSLVTLALVLLPGLLLLAAWIFGIRRYRAPWQTLGLARPRARGSFLFPWVALFLSLAFGGLYASVVEVAGIDSLLPAPIPAGALGDGLPRAVNVGFIGIVGPFAEEAFFRGFLLAALVQSIGKIRAVVLGSALFAVSHGVVAIMLPAFVSGILLSWLYLKTRSIWPPFMAHAAQNLIAVSFAV